MKILKTFSLAVVIALTVISCSKNGDLKGTTWKTGEQTLFGFTGASLEFSKTTVTYNVILLNASSKMYDGTYTKSGNTVSIAWGEEMGDETLTINGKEMTSENGTVYTKD
jgi:acetoacetate decarboxylase